MESLCTLIRTRAREKNHTGAHLSGTPKACSVRRHLAEAAKSKAEEETNPEDFLFDVLRMRWDGWEGWQINY